MATQYLRPTYYDKFSCVGGDCEDNCCKGWSIHIDKATFRKYRNLRGSLLSPLLNEYVVRRKDGEVNNNAYAQIKLNGKGVCPFLLEDGFCRIQRELGEQYLSYTCRSYPRKYNMMLPDLLELSYVMSCPEVIRIALFQPDISFEVLDHVKTDGNAVPKIPRKDQKGGTLQPYAWQVREAVIDILQCRNMGLADRIFAVGMLLQKVSVLAREDKGELLLGALEQFVAAALAGQFQDTLRSTPNNETLQKTMESVLFKDLLINDYLTSFRDNILLHCNPAAFVHIQDWYRGIMESEELREQEYEKLHHHTKSCISKNWEGILEQRQHILENFFVNYVFSELFPFGFQEFLDPYQHFVLLAELYAMLRLLLCCGQLSGEHSDEFLIKVIRAVSVSAQHNQKARHISEAYTETEHDSLAHMSFLLRD